MGREKRTTIFSEARQIRRHKNNGMTYYGATDLWEYSNQLEKDDVPIDPMGIHHGESSNLESPESTQPLSPILPQVNQEPSIGSAFVQNAPNQPVDLDDVDAQLFSMLEDMKNKDEITQQEIQLNYDDDFIERNYNNKACTEEESISDLYENQEYHASCPPCFEQPHSSGIIHDMPPYHMPHQTDDHVDQLVSLTETPIILDNSENVPTTSIQCPNTKQFFDIPNTELVKFLHEKGKKKQETPQMTDEEIKQLIRRFCIPREMGYVDQDDAKKLVNSGFKIKRVEKKIMKKQGKKFVKRQIPYDQASDQSEEMNFHCLICPLTQNDTRSFSRKEDLKRHYHQHLSFVRFECNFPGCTYSISRVDHMKTHMKNCHNGSNDFTKHD